MKDTVDPHAVTELTLYIENDAKLYETQVQPALASHAKKVKAGTYDPTLARRDWERLAKLGAILYTHHFDAPNAKYYHVFPAAVRREVARRLQESYQEELNYIAGDQP